MTPHRGPHGVDLSKRRGVTRTAIIGLRDAKADELRRRIQAREAGK